MLIHAFAGEIIERVRSEPVREELDKIIWAGWNPIRTWKAGN